MATLNSSSTTGTTPTPGHNAPSPPPDTSPPGTPADPVTKDPPAAPSTSESMRPSEPGGQALESGCGLVPPKETGEPREEAGCGGFSPKDLGVQEDKEQEEEGGGLPPVDLSNHLFFTAGGEAYLVAKLSLSGGSELLLPKGFPWGEVGIKEEPSLPLLAHLPSAHLTALHIQHGFDPIQGFSSSDQILSHDTSAPSPATCEGRDGAFWSYQLAPNPPGDPKDGPMGSRGGDHRALFWLCLLCRLGFSRAQAFMGHTQSHGVKLTPAQHLGLPSNAAVLQVGDEGRMALLSFLEPKPPARPPLEMPLDNSSMVNTEANVAQTEDGPPEAEAPVLPAEEVRALSPPSPATTPTTWDPSPTQAKESPMAAGEAGPDWFPEGQEEEGGLCPPLNQSSPASKEGGTLSAPVGSPEDPSDPPQPYRLAEDYTPAPAAFQGLSLSSHMSLLHSRNSCKTLKCPKCNWHYKYQQTLDVHMREKHPESNSHCSYCSAGGAHPRLARGESYNCGYKPYRCDVCNYSTTTKGNLSIHMQSDKHLANLQGFQAGPGGQGSPPEAPLPSSAGDKEPKTKSSWQCKVCSYETNISRNLRIHMTSEKHMQNVLMLHQGLPLGLPPGLVGPGPPPSAGAAPATPPELFQYFGPQALGQPQAPLPGPGLRPDKPLEAQLLLNGFHHLGAPARKFPPPAPGSLSPDTHLPPSQLLGSLSDSLPTSPPPDDSPSLKVFRCLVCQAFSTDNLELLLYHCSVGRSLPEAEWKEVAGDTHRCKLCCYGTQLKANFQLHLKTDKHAQKYQLAAHLREGGGAVGTPSPVPLGDGAPYGSVPPLHLRCNICDFESNSKEKMQLHARGAAHEENSQIYKFLLEMEGAAAGAELGLFRCLLCAWETPSRLAVLQHLRAPAHRDAQAQRRLQLLQSGPAAEEGLSALQSILSFSHGQLRTPGKPPVTPLAELPTPEKDAQNKTEQLASEEVENKSGSRGDSANQTTVRTGVFCCPYCSFLSPEPEQVRAHTLSQHAVQPKYRCPLCQEQLVGRPALHFHLSHLHNVVPECVEKLLLVATTVEMTFTTKVLPGPTLCPLGDAPEPPAPGPEPEPSREQGAEGPQLTPEASPDPLPEPPPPLAEAPDKPPGSPDQPPSPAPSPASRPDVLAEELAPPPTMAEEEEGRVGEPRPAEPAPSDSRHPLTYRKTTNFALDKFLDPARPYKCTVCKESFTQKNILLVHYNSVSHLHKMKKAAIDPSGPARGEAGAAPPTAAATDKPFKCTVCRVSYNQSSTLEIHMRSVLHQTRSRGTKTDAKAEGPERGQEEPKEESEAGGARPSEERSRAGGRWPPEEEESSRGNLPPLLPAGRRFSRTKFTEFQTQALQSFFETSAYPKDGEVERLASLLGLATRVVVVWFQNARQKARKNAIEGGPVPSGGGSGGASGCRRCHATFSCVFELVRHLKKCYDDQPPEEEEEEAEREEEEEEVEEEDAEEEQSLEPPARPGGPSPEPADREELSQAEATNPGGKEPEGRAPPSPSPVHACEQCTMSFPSQDLLTSHRRLHFMPSLQPGAAPHLLDLPLLVFGERSPLVAGAPQAPGPLLKRKHEEGSLSPTGSEAGGGGEGEPPRDKRLRTTILPEQLEILYRWYMQDSNPTRKMLDCISEEVGLKKRVVQVWFQNTRARERKGQFRSTPGGVPNPAVKPPITPAPAAFPKFNLLLGKVDDGSGREAPKREAPAFPYPPVTPAAGPLAFLPPGKEATTPTPEPPLPLPPPPPPSEEEATEEPSKASPESEACSPSAGDLSDSSASSLAEPESPGAGGSSGGTGSGVGVPDGMGQRRYRTQMSSLQLKIMKACYEAYRTPTMQECEVLGEEIGLPKRVIQVWFQNARAKEKKAKLQGAAVGGAGGNGEGPLGAQRTDCPYCDVKYDFYVSCRGHLFSRQHLAKLKEAVRAQLKSESKCYELAPAPEAPPAPKAPPATTPASVPLGAGPALPRLAPVLLSGPALAQPPLGSLAPFNSGPAASSGLLGLATSVLPATTVVQTAGPGCPLPQRPVPEQTNNSTAGITDPAPGPPTEPSGDKVSGERKPIAAPTNSSTDALKNLKALKATVPALLGGQFLPFPLPPAGGATPPAVFGPQLQGAYFQQLYGMKKGLFPMNPVIPQTLIGLLPNALLQPPPQPPEPTATAPPKPPELPAPGEGEAGEADELLSGSTGISTVDVTHRYLCRQCKMAFDGEAPATAHQRSFCFFGRGSGGSVPPPLRVPICTYHCLACEVLLSGHEALASHLRSSAHRRKAAPPPGGPPITVTNAATAATAAVAFAKEEARLPHTDSNPKTTTTSTLLAL
ncbi:zinc finger homeobox protein 2 isoform X6 [Prionailurus viverrinus]|uniref:zinc finger homeobox protein 2 isoform X6 n=1 Tax=Prionailurus viverrinus TaxID=61388 RepID=UPI001FF23827|nr:zinc finger homeobox protein 2 isoform X6 [Prionailurus viverrinus]